MVDIDPTRTIAVLMCCHNRRAKTLAALKCLYQAAESVGVDIHTILVDDGSTDGTAEAVLAQFPETEVLHTDGSCYWNGAMRIAFAAAVRQEHAAYLWLNDDTQLFRTGLATMLQSLGAVRQAAANDCIVVGATKSQETGNTSYGGVIRSHPLIPFRYRLLDPQPEPTACDTMNGNCVLIPHNIACALGNLAPEYVHAMGDTDYGLRARKAGFGVYLATQHVGFCERNSILGTFTDSSLAVRQRLRVMRSPKGLPVRPWLAFTRRHGGFFWPLYFIWPYLRVLLSLR